MRLMHGLVCSLLAAIVTPAGAMLRQSDAAARSGRTVPSGGGQPTPPAGDGQQSGQDGMVAKDQPVDSATGGQEDGGNAVPVARVRDARLAPYAPAGSPPPPADPRNLEGTYVNTFFVIAPFTSVLGQPAPYTPEAQNIVWHRLNMSHVGTPVAEPGVLCRPPGLTRDMNEGSPFQIVQGRDKVVFLTEEGHSVRIVRMNAKHPADLKHSYMGDSVGRWEGDTLVIDTIGFNPLTWIDFAGSPHSDQLHVVERIRRVDLSGPYKDLQDLITIDDPVYYKQPWTYLRTYRWRPDELVSEYNCEENMRPEAVEGIVVEDPRLTGTVQ